MLCRWQRAVYSSLHHRRSAVTRRMPSIPLGSQAMSEMRRCDAEQRARHYPVGLGQPRCLSAPVCEDVRGMTSLTVPCLYVTDPYSRHALSAGQARPLGAARKRCGPCLGWRIIIWQNNIGTVSEVPCYEKNDAKNGTVWRRCTSSKHSQRRNASLYVMTRGNRVSHAATELNVIL